MLKQVNQAALYTTHFIKSKNEHGIHSPFLFDLLTNCIYADIEKTRFIKIEDLRNNLKKNNTVIKVTDLGAGSSYDGIKKKRSVSSITSKFSKSPRMCRLLYKLSSFFKPGIMIELGTSMGISAMYQASGNPDGMLYTVEGCKSTYEQARINIEESKIQNIVCINNDFDNALPKLIHSHKHIDWAYIDGNHTYNATLKYFNTLADSIHENSVLIFDDINWSPQMRNAWKEICSDSRVTMTLDLFFVGLVFFRKNLTKQDFKIRF